MIRAHFGLVNDPFSAENITLLPHQPQVLDIVRVHCQQGGFCLIMGEPGTGKSVLKRALCEFDSKRLITPVVNRTCIRTTQRSASCARRLRSKPKGMTCAASGVSSPKRAA
jgi:ABC-type cobalamin/Fe3+-siderophores transport system ATPase subunit